MVCSWAVILPHWGSVGHWVEIRHRNVLFTVIILAQETSDAQVKLQCALGIVG